jgi:hypothetical protein
MTREASIWADLISDFVARSRRHNISARTCGVSARLRCLRRELGTLFTVAGLSDSLYGSSWRLI